MKLGIRLLILASLCNFFSNRIYRKWNAKLFVEMYQAYKSGRSQSNPVDFWYKVGSSRSIRVEIVRYLFLVLNLISHVCCLSCREKLGSLTFTSSVSPDWLSHSNAPSCVSSLASHMRINCFVVLYTALAKKLKECGVFGVSSDEFLDYAVKNRQEWEQRGEEVVAELVEKYCRED